MDITPLIPRERLALTGYGAGGFSLNQVKREGSLFLSGAYAGVWDEQLTLASLAPHLEQSTVELLIIGTGATTQPVPPELRKELRARGIAVESMDTGAACRTYNVVMSEDRRAAAALVAI